MSIMKDNTNMKMTLSVSKEEKEIFDTLCKRETHGPSDQLRHMMKFYLNGNIQHKDLMKLYNETVK